MLLCHSRILNLRDCIIQAPETFYLLYLFITFSNTSLTSKIFVIFSYRAEIEKLLLVRSCAVDLFQFSPFVVLHASIFFASPDYRRLTRKLSSKLGTVHES